MHAIELLHYTVLELEGHQRAEFCFSQGHPAEFQVLRANLEHPASHQFACSRTNVYADPLTFEPMGNDKRGPATSEGIENDVTRIATRFHDFFEEFLGLLRRVPESLAVAGSEGNIPNIVVKFSVRVYVIALPAFVLRVINPPLLVLLPLLQCRFRPRF